MNLNLLAGAELLSLDDFSILPIKMRRYSTWWWLSSAGVRPNYALGVNPDGSVDQDGNFVAHQDIVRPILTLSVPGSVPVGTTFEFGRIPFEVVSRRFAFCQADIGICSFNMVGESGNNYMGSTIETYVKRWFHEAYAQELGMQDSELSPEEEMLRSAAQRIGINADMISPYDMSRMATNLRWTATDLMRSYYAKRKSLENQKH